MSGWCSYARRNFVAHPPSEQASILRFIEDNWSLGRLGDRSFDARAGSIAGLLDQDGREVAPVALTDPELDEELLVAAAAGRLRFERFAALVAEFERRRPLRAR